MNNEHIENKMKFIVEQQAQFASDIQRLDQVVVQMGDVVTRLATVTHSGFNQVNAKINVLVDAQIRTEENLARTNENVSFGLNQVNAKISALVDAQIRTEENLTRIEQNVTRTEENVARTDENLRNLISVVDRYIIEGRNGK